MERLLKDFGPYAVDRLDEISSYVLKKCGETLGRTVDMLFMESMEDGSVPGSGGESVSYLFLKSEDWENAFKNKPVPLSSEYIEMLEKN